MITIMTQIKWKYKQMKMNENWKYFIMASTQTEKSDLKKPLI